MNISYSKSLFSTFAVLSLLGATADAAPRHIDCDAGATISDALESAAGSAKLLEITVRGECNEVVTIRRDVTIDGLNDTVINGVIRVFNGHANISNLRVTGQGHGIIVSGGPLLITQNVWLAGNQGNGLVIRRNSSVIYRGGGIEGNGDSGIFLEDGYLFMRDGTWVAFNQGDGVQLDLGSKAILQNSFVVSNGAVGVSATLHSLVDMTGSTYVADNDVHGAVAVQDSAIRISSVAVNVYGFIHCGDDESSLETGGAGPIDTDCTGF
jgi:hypothetical protein